MTAIVWTAGGLVYLGLIALVLVLNHGAHSRRSEHPRPERPSIGEDPTSEDDEYDEKQHAAWLEQREPPV